MLQKNFKIFFLEEILNFLWRQWSALGVLGSSKAETEWIIDPEALLLFTCTIGRYDARLFDEVLDWLNVNGNFVNIQRLRNILRKEQFRGDKVISAVANVMKIRTKSYKWKLLAVLNQNEYMNKTEPLFFFKDGKPIENYGKTDEDFRYYGFLRGKKELTGKTQQVNIVKNTGMLFKLRALFGVNTRCEIILYLLVHESAHPSLIAREIYYSQKTVQDTLIEMTQSGLIFVRSVGKEKQYTLYKDKWYEFLKYDNEPLQWVNWAQVLSALEKIWIKLNDKNMLEYDSLLQSSELRVLMHEIRPKIENAGFPQALTNDSYFLGEKYSEIFIQDIKKLLG